MVSPLTYRRLLNWAPQTGFDFELIDRAGLYLSEKLTRARNQLFGEVAKYPDLAVGVLRPNGPEDTPQFKIDIDQKSSGAAKRVY